jgi:hypothetical protein
MVVPRWRPWGDAAPVAASPYNPPSVYNNQPVQHTGLYHPSSTNNGYAQPAASPYFHSSAYNYRPVPLASIYTPTINTSQNPYNPAYLSRSQALSNHFYDRMGVRSTVNDGPQAARHGIPSLIPFGPLEISSDEDEDEDEDEDNYWGAGSDVDDPTEKYDNPKDAGLLPASDYPQEPCGGILPTDEHQDDIVVGSVEGDPRYQGAITGCDDYLRQLKGQKYETIRYNFVKQYVQGRLGIGTRYADGSVN